MLAPDGTGAIVAEPLASEFSVRYPFAASLLLPAIVRTEVLATANTPEVMVLVPVPLKVTFLNKVPVPLPPCSVSADDPLNIVVPVLCE